MCKNISNTESIKGFTIIETLIALSISLVGTLAGYLLITNMNQSIAGSSAVTQAQQEGRIIIEHITRELRESSPEKIWPASLTYTNSNYLYFYTPRDEAKAFKIDSSGKPLWQKIVWYIFEQNSNRLIRYELYLPDPNNPFRYSNYRSEVVSDKVKNLAFGRSKDMITISIRTFQNKAKNTANSYADFNTKIKLRN
jgi:prepilin-type N-terminal cleavage/methylation domain-containing protein